MFVMRIATPREATGLGVTAYMTPPRMFEKQHMEMLTAVFTTIIPGVVPVLHVPQSPSGFDLPSEASMLDSFTPGGGDGGDGGSGSGVRVRVGVVAASVAWWWWPQRVGARPPPP